MTGLRGQTTQDFAIGTSVLLLTIIGAFLYIQTGGLSVYEQPTAGVDQPQADRIASYLVEEYSAPGDPNTLEYNSGPGSIDDELLADESDSANPSDRPKKLTTLIAESGTNVASDRRTDPIVNVSIINATTLERGQRVPALDGTGPSATRLAWGEYRRADSVTSTRVVRLTNDGTTPQCTPTCWMVVRVW